MAGEHLIANAIERTLISPNVSDSNLEAANVVDAIDKLAAAASNIAYGLCDPNAAPGRDANDGTVGCVTEAIMGITGGLFRIAHAIEDLAEAIREGR